MRLSSVSVELTVLRSHCSDWEIKVLQGRLTSVLSACLPVLVLLAILELELVLCCAVSYQL